MDRYIKNLPNIIMKSLNIVVTDVNNHIVYISECYEALMGYKSEDLIGKSPSIFRYPGIKNVPILDVLNNHNVWNGVLKNIKKTGEPVYFNANIYKDFDENGNHIGYHSIHTNITKTITNPHKFIFENELLTTLLAGSDEAVLICLDRSNTNEKHKIVEISQDLLDFLKIDIEEIIENKLTVTDIIASNCCYYKDLDLLMRDFDSEIDVIVFFDTNPNIKFRVTYIKFNFNNNPEHPAMLLKLNNITKELTATHQLTNIIESKNAFLANLSHEIKTPLNAVFGFLTLLKARETDKEKLEFINIISNSVRNVIELTNDTIDFSGMDNNSIQIVPRKFTPAEIQNSIEAFFAKSIEKGIEFSVFISPQLPNIMFQDILRLKQIITNLISNAVKFVPANDGVILIDCHYYQGELHFVIEDNGIGISKEQQKIIFDPFSQASKDIKGMYGGTGLGLAVVKRIVDMMGGELTVESDIGCGSAFSVSVPVKMIEDCNIAGKIDIPTIFIFAPTFSPKKIDTIKKYLVHFTYARIHKFFDIEHLLNVKNSFIFINFSDVDLETIKLLSVSNKLVIVKKMDVITTNLLGNTDNITEITLPIIGSKIFDALNLLINNVSKKNFSNDVLDISVSGKILVADDAEQNILLIKTLLSKNVDLDVAYDGEQVFEKFKNNIIGGRSSYDLILLDMNMPKLTGYEAAELIREYETEHNMCRTPLVALTANRYLSTDDEILKNMDEYLPKPIMLNKLLSVIVKYTSSNRQFITTEQSFDKIGKLKEIRDAFVSDKNLKDIYTDEFIDYFNEEEKSLLNDLLELKKDDREMFNKTYNSILKFIRRTN